MLVLWAFCSKNIHSKNFQPPPLTRPRPILLPYPYKTNIYIGCMVFYWKVVSLPGTRLRETYLFFSISNWQWIIARVKGQISWHYILHPYNEILSWLSKDFIHTFTMISSSYTQLPWAIQNIHFLAVNYQLLLIYFFWPFSQNDTWALGGGGILSMFHG